MDLGFHLKITAAQLYPITGMLYSLSSGQEAEIACFFKLQLEVLRTGPVDGLVGVEGSGATGVRRRGATPGKT